MTITSNRHEQLINAMTSTTKVLDSGVANFLEEQITLLYTRTDKAVDAAKVRFLGRELRNMIVRYYNSITEGEVAHIFEEGLYESYGKNYGINLPTFKGWFDAYYKSSEFINAKAAIAPKAIAQASTITEEEKDIMQLQKAVELFEERKAGQKVNHVEKVWELTYNVLNKYGFITADKAIKMAFMDEARTQLAREYECKRTRHSSMLSDYLNVMTLSSAQEAVIGRAKKMMVQTYFDNMIEKGEDLAIF